MQTDFAPSSLSFLNEEIKTIFSHVSSLYQNKKINLNDLFKKIAELQVLITCSYVFYFHNFNIILGRNYKT